MSVWLESHVRSIYLQSGLELHRSAADGKVKPDVRTALKLAQNLVSHLIIIAELKRYVRPFGVEFVDWIVL